MLCKCTFDRPAAIKTMLDGRGWDTNFARPFGQRHGAISIGQAHIGARVSVLLSNSCPSAVARCIGSVVVDALNAMMCRWSRTHVGVEALEGIHPLVTDGDPSTAVAHETRVAPIPTSSAHQNPDVVLGCLGEPMGREHRARHFAMQATTGSAQAIAKNPAGNSTGVAAIATTGPLLTNVFNSCEPPESLARQVDQHRARAAAKAARRLPALVTTTLTEAVDFWSSHCAIVLSLTVRYLLKNDLYEGVA